jgi:hypothetical protein
LQTEFPTGNNQLYKNTEEGSVDHMGNPQRWEGWGGVWVKVSKQVAGRLIQDLHSATSQKSTFFIVTDVKTSDLTQYLECFLFILSLLWRLFTIFY